MPENNITPVLNFSENIKLEKKERKVEFDFIKCFAIFLVLCGHSLMHFSDADHMTNLLYQFITSFHMPLFMAVAGYFSYRSMQLSFKIFLQKKFWQLIYPCLSFGFIYCIFIPFLLELSALFL